MKTPNTSVIALVVLGLASVANVQASFVSDGDPFPIGSWAQGFNESGVGNFTQVETIFRSGPGGPFEAPGFSSFSQPGWAPGLVTSTHVTATGPALNNLTWNIAFLGNQSQPLTFDFYAWNNTTLAESVRAVWNGGSWAFDVKGAEFLSSPSPVPEPTTILTGALLLLPFGVSTYRILRQKSAA